MILEEQILLLLVISTIVAIGAKKWKLPYTIALVIAGLGLGLMDVKSDLHLTKDLVFAIFLPALLFEAAFHLDLEHFRKNAGPILVLAVIGVILSLLMCGGLTYLGLKHLIGVQNFGIMFALLFGALISATDPISVLAIFKTLGVSPRLNLVVEGESLFNDGTAVVMFSLILAAVSGHDAHGSSVESISASWVGLMFAKEVFGGLMVGLVTGMALSFVTTKIEDHLIEIMLTTVLAYGTYLIAENLHVSGVIGVVAAGMASGNYGMRYGMSPTSKLSVISFWEYTAFVINSLIFLLIGMEVKIDQLLEYKYHILIAWIAVVLARAIALNFLFPIINKLFRPLPWKWSPVLVWGGLRGSLSMALALSLIDDVPGPQMEMILSMTFGVVVISILFQAMTIKPLLSKLGMMSDERHSDYEELSARIKSSHAVLTEIKQLYRSRSISADVHDLLVKEYEATLSNSENAINEYHESNKALQKEEINSTRRHLLAVEKDSLRESYHLGVIAEDALKELVGELDAKLDELEEAIHSEEEGENHE